MRSSIKELRRLTDQFTAEFSDLVVSRGNGIIKYTAGNGEICEGRTIANTDKFAIQTCFMNKGEVFHSHTHNEHEWVILLSGDIEMVVEDDVGALIRHILIEPGDFVYIPPVFKHHIPVVNKDTLMLGITIPPSNDYPD
jgi:mannose-6-phosphate isomerase-like protein (cupin superfamily)